MTLLKYDHRPMLYMEVLSHASYISKIKMDNVLSGQTSKAIIMYDEEGIVHFFGMVQYQGYSCIFSLDPFDCFCRS